MATLADRYQDELIRHAVELERYKGGLAERAIAILNETEDDLEMLLRRRLARLRPGAATFDRQATHLERLLKAVRDQRAAAHLAMRNAVKAELFELGKDEVGFLQGAFERAAQIEDLFLAAPVASAVRAAITSRPFVGRNLGQWFQSLQAADARALEQAIRIGFIEGQTVDQIVRRVRGTRANQFTDGALQITRRNAETVVRTGVQHAANAARDAVFAENSDIILGQVWTSTLDGRTTPICQARDGKVSVPEGTAIPPGLEPLSPPQARPPAHPNCRSVMVPMMNPEGVLGNRPFVRSTQRRQAREVNFRESAREKAGSRWRSMSRSERNAATRRAREAWARDNIGTVPAQTDYQSWLRRQPASFQDEVLGTTRAKLFREGGLSLDRFIDASGKRYNLNQLRRREASAFRAADLTT